MCQPVSGEGAVPNAPEVATRFTALEEHLHLAVSGQVFRKMVGPHTGEGAQMAPEPLSIDVQSRIN